jgi:hypothetical protein
MTRTLVLYFLNLILPLHFINPGAHFHFFYLTLHSADITDIFSLFSLTVKINKVLEKNEFYHHITRECPNYNYSLHIQYCYQYEHF